MELQYFGKDLEAMSFAKNYHAWIIYEFKPYLGDSVAEVGAGTGNFSSFLVDAGVKRLMAFEPSHNMFPLLASRFNSSPTVDTINAFFEDYTETFSEIFSETFDSVLYVNVLEHIEQDEKALCCAYRTIKKNGHLLIFVPALNWLYSELDKKVGHFRRYHKKQLEQLVKSVGFSIEKLKYFDIAGIIPWYIAFTLLKKTTTAGNVSLYDRLIVPPMRILENLMTPPIGKNLLLVAKKI